MLHFMLTTLAIISLSIILFYGALTLIGFVLKVKLKLLQIEEKELLNKLNEIKEEP